MTLISELIKIPEQVHKSDYVISLKSAIEQPARTIDEYVVTEQLAESFDRALSLITSAVADRTSKSSYLHASFGAGKSAFMAVTYLLLQSEPAARAKAGLAPVVAKYDSRLNGRKFLLVPYQAVGASSLEQVVLGGYVEHIQTLHPGAPLPAVYVADGILTDAAVKRIELGDELFFRILSEGESADEWGDYGGQWDGARFDTAMAAPPGDGERDAVLSALLHTHYRAVPGQASATADGFVPIDDGLEAISRHARDLGYDAVVLFLDELVLWLASRMSDVAFVSREGAKVVKLVEGDDARRPAPIVSLIARQRDLRELVGEHVPGAQSLSAVDILRHSEGRFDTITLEDRNLPEIAAQRLLRPRSVQAEQVLDDEFAALRRQLDERGERDVLLTETGDLQAFRRLYPFSPALVDALVALSGAMQRERTALKVMAQLLVDNRNRLSVGQLVPLGDLYDAINAGDEPLTEVMRSQFAQARRLWSQRFEPMLLRTHQLRSDDIDGLAVSHPFVTDARLAKSLLIAALVPEVAVLRGMTVSRLTALNAGIVRAFIPGTERQQVLDKLRTWASEIGELRLGEDEHDPTVAVVLQGIDTGPILDAARTVDNSGERRRRLKDLLGEMLQLKGADTLEPWIDVEWRGFVRRVNVVFANVRDELELPDESLRATVNPLIVVDYPWDTDDHGPRDDVARADDFRRDRPGEWTAVWLTNFLSEQSLGLLGRLVKLEYVLTGDNFDRLAGHLSSTDRPLARSQLHNEKNAVRDRMMAILRQSYGVDPAQAGTVDVQLQPGEQVISLDAGVALRPVAGPSLRAYAEGIARQLYDARLPKHPLFTEKVTVADLRHTLVQVTLALGQPNGRLENVEPTMRRVLTRVANPLQLGAMHAAHFIVDLHTWIDLVDRRRAASGTTTMSIGTVRAWLDGADTPSERRGMTTETADLVILALAAATNRTLVDAGRPVARPEIGRLRDGWELRPQALPSEDVWAVALQRAREVGIVPISDLRSATAVSDLGDRLLRELVGDRADAVRAVPASLRRLDAVVPVGGDTLRLRTAIAAASLVDALARQPDQAAETLARHDVPTTAAALGTAIKQAPAVVGAVRGFNTELVDQATALGGEFAADAARLKERLTQAVEVDELTAPLVGALDEAERAATDLLGQAARARLPVPEQGPTPGPQPELPRDPVAHRARTRSDAEEALAQLEARLRQAGMQLTWRIEDVADGDG